MRLNTHPVFEILYNAVEQNKDNYVMVKNNTRCDHTSAAR